MSSWLAFLMFLSFVPSPQNDPGIQENLRVVFRDIRLHVTDRNGDPVEGLKADDFIITENGETRQITFFEEVKPREEVASGAFGDEPEAVSGAFDESKQDQRNERNMVIVLDSSNMRFDAFGEFKKVINEFIEENVSESDLVKIVQLEDRLIHLSPFLKSKNLLKAALAQAEYKGKQFRELDFQEGQVLSSYSDYLDESDPDLRDFYLSNLRTEVTRKEMIKNAYFKNFHSNMKQIAQIFDQMTGAKSIFLFSGGGYVRNKGFEKVTQPMSKDLGLDLNSSNVTVYSFVHVPGTPAGAGTGITSTRNFDFLPNPFKELGPRDALAVGTLLEEPTQLLSAPSQASELTGGVLSAAHSISGIAKEYENFSNRIHHYYRLGYTLEAPKKSTSVRIKLKEKERGWDLHYGQKFNPKKSYLEMTESERTVAFGAGLQYSQSYRNDLNCQWGYSGFPGQDRGETIPAYINLTTEKFPKKGFEVGFAALNDQRDLLDITTATIKNQGDSRDFLLYDLLLPPARPYYIRFQIINLDNGMQSLFELPYERQSFEESSFHICAIEIADNDNRKMIPINQFRYAEMGEKATIPKVGLRKVLDPFAMDQAYFRPAIVDQVPPGPGYSVFFQLKNAGDDLENYTVFHELQSEGRVIESEFKVALVHPYDNRTRSFVAQLKPSQPLVPGQYTLGIQVSDDTGQKVAKYFRRFRVESPGKS